MPLINPNIVLVKTLLEETINQGVQSLYVAVTSQTEALKEVVSSVNDILSNGFGVLSAQLTGLTTSVEAVARATEAVQQKLEEFYSGMTSSLDAVISQQEQASSYLESLGSLLSEVEQNQEDQISLLQTIADNTSTIENLTWAVSDGQSFRMSCKVDDGPVKSYKVVVEGWEDESDDYNPVVTLYYVLTLSDDSFDPPLEVGRFSVQYYQALKSGADGSYLYQTPIIRPLQSNHWYWNDDMSKKFLVIAPLGLQKNPL